ncbi:MAG TPA: mannitol dehydrogenase family protein [Candidatus Dorea intestinavium]|nr:mannitol dehydrogenase family protein [Candidatus Dorea intestinavium]
MKLTIEGLKEKEAFQKAGIKLPTYEVAEVAKKTKEQPRWVHFGAGNIFRIFIGGLADQLIENKEMESGITCVETFDFDVIDKIYKPFDNLTLGITLNADGSTDKQVLGALGEALTTREEDKERLKEIAVDPKLQMFSFTITEKGYALKDAKGEYFPWIRADIKAGPEKANSAMGVVCGLLYERFQAGELPLAVVSMDNCSHNGEILMNAIVTLAKEWVNLGFFAKEFLAYLEDENKISFPWSMIDKITPRPAESVAKELEERGFKEMNPLITSKNTYIAPYVNAEAPQYLVIEDKFPNGRPKFEKVGVYLTNRETVNKVERMKVTTCLNPLHTALAVYGCILGYTLISKEMADPELKKLVWQIGPVEGMKVVTDPGILSPKEFVKEVIEVRLPNPFMPDAPQRIATDTSQKVGIRFGETIKSYVAEYGDAKKLKAIPLAIAGWCRYLLGVDDNGEVFERSADPMLEELSTQLAGVKFGNPASYKGQLKPLLSNSTIFGSDLYKAGIGEKIEELFVAMISEKGAVRKVLKEELN